jgi:hypothetical protein
MFTINPPVLKVADGKARVTSTIVDGDVPRDLWFEVEAAHQAYLPTDALDAFVIACLLPAMMAGKNIVVKGEMSSKLYYNITHLLIAALKVYLPTAHLITVKADRLLTSYAGRGSGVLSGFSGGIDSFCNYYDHTGDRSPDEYRITHFVYNNVGSHGQHGSDNDFNVFATHAQKLRQFAEEEGKPLITVNSNLDSFMGMNFQLTHTIRNVTVALLLQKLASKFLYPSCSQIRYTEVKPSFDIAGLDAVILPLLGTEHLECITSGAQYERSEKTAIVANMPTSWRYLDVCVEPYHAKTGKLNCSRCWKCMRTQMTLDACGKLENYGQVFDLAEYQRYKKLFMLDVLCSHNNHQEDLAAMLNKHNFVVPRSVQLISAILPCYIGHRIAKRIMPRFFNRPKLMAFINAVLSF